MPAKNHGLSLLVSCSNTNFILLILRKRIFQVKFYIYKRKILLDPKGVLYIYHVSKAKGLFQYYIIFFGSVSNHVVIVGGGVQINSNPTFKSDGGGM